MHNAIIIVRNATTVNASGVILVEVVCHTYQKKWIPNDLKTCKLELRCPVVRGLENILNYMIPPPVRYAGWVCVFPFLLWEVFLSTNSPFSHDLAKKTVWHSGDFLVSQHVHGIIWTMQNTEQYGDWQSCKGQNNYLFECLTSWLLRSCLYRVETARARNPVHALKKNYIQVLEEVVIKSWSKPHDCGKCWRNEITYWMLSSFVKRINGFLKALSCFHC